MEVLALCQQVAVLKRKRRRLVLSRLERLFWIMLRSVWPRWSENVLAIVKPATVIAWHQRHRSSHIEIGCAAVAGNLPEADPYRYIIFEKDSKFNGDVIRFLTATGLQPKRTSIQAPWQNACLA